MVSISYVAYASYQNSLPIIQHFMHNALCVIYNLYGCCGTLIDFHTTTYKEKLTLLVVNSSVIVSCSFPLSLVEAPMLTSPVAAISNRQRSSSPQMDRASSSSSGSENSTPNAGV